MSRSPVEELALSDLDRSNKGASKQRRDLINAEIAIMRDLLPLSESARQRLSQLQVMSLSCVFIRKCNVLGQLFSSLPAESDMPSMCDFSQALSGFLLITTREGKLVYISENVTDYLGHSMVDMKTQGDSLFDIVDKRDEATVRAHLLQASSAASAPGANSPPTANDTPGDLSAGPDVSFFCRMNMSRTLKRQSAFGDVKVMHVRGHFLPLSDPSSPTSDGTPSPHPTHPHHPHQHQQQKKFVFMAVCSPLIMPELKESLIQSNTMVFKTVHNMDMTFLEVTKTAEYHLGCSTEEICKASWYSMLHPEDIHEAREKHILLMRATHELGCMMTVRMLTRKGEVMWVNVVMQVRQSATPATTSSSSTPQNSEDGVIVCINQVISEDEAIQLRLQSPTFTLYPPRTKELWNTSQAMMTPSQQPDAIFWRSSSSPSSVSASPPVHRPGLTPNPMMSSCASLAQHHPQALPPTPPGYLSVLGPSGYQHIASSSSAPSSSSSSSSSTAVMLSSSSAPVYQTDKLKLMLKRKLQNPSVSQPSSAKIPKMAVAVESRHATRNRSCNNGQGFGCTTIAGGACSMKMGGKGPNEGFSWSGPSPVMPPHAQYIPLSSSVGQDVKASSMVMSSAGQSCLSPPLGSAVMAVPCQGTEQVVPQSQPIAASISVPESYLTPDSSPASSPEPQTPSRVKGTATAAAAVLKDLEKLPVFLQEKSSATVATTAAVAVATGTASGLWIKSENKVQECGRGGHRRELPFMDASDIESFFHTLDCSEQFTAVLMENQGQTPLPEMTPKSKENQPTFIKATAATVEQALTGQAPHMKIKQEPAAALPFSAVSQQQQQVQLMPKKAKEEQLQVHQSHDELEELLGFFAGEMTATQLNLEGLLGSSSLSPREDGVTEEKWQDSSQPQSWEDGQGTGVCGAGHLDPFLFQGSPLGRPNEGFCPVSPSEVSGDEDNSGNSGSSVDIRDKLSSPALSSTTAGGEEEKKHGCGSPISGPSPSPSAPFHPHPQTSPQDGMEEEDELYQLDKLLSQVASGNGMMLFPDSQ